MSTRRIIIHQAPIVGECVWYVMARDQRRQANPALNRAAEIARQVDRPLAIVFCLTKATPNASREHYRFMLDGLREFERDLPVNVPLMLMIGPRREWLQNLARHTRPAAVVFDHNPAPKTLAMQVEIAREMNVYAEVVDAQNIVPVWVEHPKQAEGAPVWRPEIYQMWKAALEDFTTDDLRGIKSWPGKIMRRDELDEMLEKFIANRESNGTQSDVSAGENAALATLEDCIARRLSRYAAQGDDPLTDVMAELSPYLHFGQISCAQVVARLEEVVSENPAQRQSVDAVFEELVVRQKIIRCC